MGIRENNRKIKGKITFLWSCLAGVWRQHPHFLYSCHSPGTSLFQTGIDSPFRTRYTSRMIATVNTHTKSIRHAVISYMAV